jgi:hypothetical protein
VGRVINFRDVPWADTTIRSWYASVTPFDATTLAGHADNIVSRFAASADRQTNTMGLGLPPHFSLPQQRIIAKGG